jgi:hypothetical protein
MVGGNPPQVLEALSTVVAKNVHEIVKALELMGFDSTGYKTGPTEAYHLKSIQSMKGDWMGFYKFKMAAWIACAKDEQGPPKPLGLEDDKGAYLLGGKAGQWLKMMKSQEPRRFEEITETMGTVKRAMERADDELLKEAERAAFKALTDFRKVEKRDVEQDLWDNIPPAEFNQEQIQAIVKRVVKEIFGDSKEEKRRFTWKDALEPFVPTTKATYLSSRSKGGAVGHILTSTLLEGLRGPDTLVTSKVVEGEDGIWGQKIDDSSLIEKFRVLYERLTQAATQEEKKVVLVALAEALKIRVISKGPVCTYTVLKPLQKWLWRAIQRHDSGAAKLIGEEITAKYMMEQLGELKEGESYLSGDYKAATDNLAPWLSEMITSELGHYIDDKRIRKLFTEALTGHWIQDPDDAQIFVKQSWGQLMGSVVSFPVLCIANLVVCLATREHQLGRNLRLRDARIAINGDDCSFRSTENSRRFWERIAHFVGLTPSVGKYFFSRKFVNMNSATFRHVQPNPEGEFLERVAFINCGLVAGQKRSTSGKTDGCTASDWGALQSISQNSHTLLRDCAKEDQVRVFKAYLNANWKVLSDSRLPWFLPEHLGGLGLPTFPDYKIMEDGKEKRPWMPTDRDLRLASVVWTLGKLPSLKPENVSWKMWDYAQERAKHLRLQQPLVVVNGPPVGSEAASQTSLMGRLCVEALFRTDMSLLYDESKTKNLLLNKVRKAVDACNKGALLAAHRPFEFDKLPLPDEVIKEGFSLRQKTLAYAESTYFAEEDG